MIYVVTAMIAQYLNVFVLIVQSFMKVARASFAGSESDRTAVCHHATGGVGAVRRSDDRRSTEVSA